MTVVLTPIGAPAGTNVNTSVLGNRLTVLCGLTFSSTYKTGGEAGLAPLLEALFKQEGNGTILFVEVNGIVSHYPFYDYTENKLKFLVATTGVELAEAAYPAGITGSVARLHSFGR